MSTAALRVVPDVMDDASQSALEGALLRFYVDDLQGAWREMHSCLNGAEPPSPDQIEVALLPLDRIGAPPGASGARVYITYFRDARHIAASEKAGVSQPFVVKIGRFDKLKREADANKRWVLFGLANGRFAVPFRLDDKDKNNSVLIAPFSSHVSLHKKEQRQEIRVHDLWTMLSRKDELADNDKQDKVWTEVRRVIDHALETVEPQHLAGRGDHRKLSLRRAEAFKRYLRDTLPNIGDGSRAHIPLLLFGNDPEVRAFDRTWPNPVRIVQAIIDDTTSYETFVGQIHGDLHPKNIVLDTHDTVQIIDFGWAEVEAPVILDYLLLDANLRATTLPSQISEANVLALAGMLAPSFDLSLLPDPVRRRGSIICDTIWKRMNAAGVVHDWTQDYLVPMLLVSFGLLAHLDSARNQAAFVALVLSVTQEVVSQWPELGAP